jgi:hypothetical protein
LESCPWRASGEPLYDDFIKWIQNHRTTRSLLCYFANFAVLANDVETFELCAVTPWSCRATRCFLLFRRLGQLLGLHRKVSAQLHNCSPIIAWFGMRCDSYCGSSSCCGPHLHCTINITVYRKTSERLCRIEFYVLFFEAATHSDVSS